MSVQKELLFYLKREIKKLRIIFQEVSAKEKGKEVFNLAKSYFEDCLHFYKQKQFVKAFELENYIWGILDSLANLGLLIIPNEIKKWFKVEQK